MTISPAASEASRSEAVPEWLPAPRFPAPDDPRRLSCTCHTHVNGVGAPEPRRRLLRSLLSMGSPSWRNEAALAESREMPRPSLKHWKQSCFMSTALLVQPDVTVPTR